MPHATSLVLTLALAVALPAAARADAFKDLQLIRPSRAMAAADFTVPGLTEQRVRLSDYKGTVVFLDFWATWCPPCKEEMPSMERLYRRYKDKGFTILALSIDAGGAEPVAAFAKQLGLTFPMGLDPDMSVANQYRLLGLPVAYLIDRKGSVAGVAIGARDWDSKAAHAVIEALLK